MKSTLIAVTLLAVASAGCGRNDQSSSTKSTNAPAASGNPITAPVDYLGAVAKAKKSSEKTIEVVSLNQAVQQFNAAEGRYPKDLIYELGSVLEQMGQRDEAIEQFKLIYERDSGYKDVAAKVDAYYAGR